MSPVALGPALRGRVELRQKYSMEKGWLDKSVFRAKWAKAEFQKWESLHKFEKVEGHDKTEGKNGRYLTLARIAVEEGGGKTGRRNSMNYCLRCIVLGGHWLKYDEEFTQSIKYLYIEHTLSEQYKTSWREFKSWSESRPPQTSATYSKALGDGAVQRMPGRADVAPEVPPDGKQEGGQPHGKAKAKAKGKSRAKAKAAPPEEPTADGEPDDGAEPDQKRRKTANPVPQELSFFLRSCRAVCRSVGPSEGPF